MKSTAWQSVQKRSCLSIAASFFCTGSYGAAAMENMCTWCDEENCGQIDLTNGIFEPGDQGSPPTMMQPWKVAYLIDTKQREKMSMMSVICYNHGVLRVYPIHGSFNRAQFNYGVTQYFLSFIERDLFLVMDNASIHNETYWHPKISHLPNYHLIRTIEIQLSGLIFLEPMCLSPSVRKVLT